MRAGFPQFAVRYMLYFAVGCSILSASQDSYVYFERTIQYWDFLPEVKDVQHSRLKTLSFKTSNANWNNHFWDATKRVSKLKSGKEVELSTVPEYIEHLVEMKVSQSKEKQGDK